MADVTSDVTSPCDDVGMSDRFCGERLWELRHGVQVLTCELRDDTRRDAGVDVQVLENGELMMTQRVARRSAAQAVAEWLRREYIQAGWADA